MEILHLIPNCKGMIQVDSPEGKEFRFTSDRFNKESYLWKVKDRIYVSFIVSREEGRGYLSALFEEIEKKGYRVAVPTPLRKMREILMRKGFKRYIERSEEFGAPVEVWMKKL